MAAERRHSWLAGGRKVGLRVLLFAFLLELSARVVAVAVPATPWALPIDFSSLAPRDDPWWIPDARLFWRLRPEPGEINQMGLRGADFERARPAGERRVLLLGDSVTFGVCVEPEDSYGAILEELLNASETGDRWRVINAGVPGYTSLQGRRYLTELLALEPELLVVYFGANDYSIRGGISDSELWVPIGRSLADTCTDWRRSYAIELVRSLGPVLRAAPSGSSGVGGDAFRPRVPPAEFSANLRAMVNQAAQHRCHTTIMSYVRNRNGTLLDFSQVYDYTVEGASTLHLWGAIQGDRRPLGDLFCDDVHMTPAGNRLVAVAIFEHLKAQGLARTSHRP